MSEMINESKSIVRSGKFERLCRMLQGRLSKTSPEGGPGVPLPQGIDECRCVICLAIRSQNVYRITDVMHWVIKVMQWL